MNVAATSSDDPAEFEQLLEAYQGRLFGLIRALAGTGAEVEDILQNTNQVLWEKSEQFESGSNLRA